MAENSHIEWTTHTFNPWLRRVLFPVTRLAKRDAIRHLEPQFGEISKALDVVSVEIAPASVAALLAGEGIAQEHVVAPSLIVAAEPLIASLGQLAVLEAVAGFAPRRALACSLADLLARLQGVLDARAIAAPFLRRLAHFGA